MVGAERGERLMAEVVGGLGETSQIGGAFRLPRPEGLHLTLFVLGDVAPGRVARLEQELAGATAGCPAPELVIDSAGAFPRRGRERVLWLGVREESGGGALEELQRRVVGAIDAAGLDTSVEGARPFRPHVTVGRPRDPRQASVPEGFYAIAPGVAWRPAEVALVESVRSRGPNRYLPVGRFPLSLE
jgi:RNA 2',3'-cyclic 3'-phosphodiesterase